MKVSIKLFSSYKETKKGFPVYLIIRDRGSVRKKCIGYSKKECWNPETKLPLKQHPDYNIFFDTLIEYRSRIAKVNFLEDSFTDTVNFIFGAKVNNPIFYKKAIETCSNTTTGKLNKTILNNFNRAFPDILIKDITPAVAKKYMQLLLINNSPNGVHTYLRKLDTIFTRISDKENPFKGVRPKKTPTKSKALTNNDILKLINTRSLLSKYDGKNNFNTVNYPRFYWLLMFYLGGIDFIDLANLRYDLHVNEGRIQFNRFKGETNVFINNKIFPEAKEILKNFKCYPYLIPAFKNKDYKKFLDRVNNNLHTRTKDLKLSKKPLSKSARYSFITRAQQLLIDERITVEIVGHTQQKIHSIYLDEFPLEVRDEAHKKIITLYNSN